MFIDRISDWLVGRVAKAHCRHSYKVVSVTRSGGWRDGLVDLNTHEVCEVCGETRRSTRTVSREEAVSELPPPP